VEQRVVLANVSADDNRGGCAITFATVGLIQRAIPDAKLVMIPAAGFSDLSRGLRHTRREFPEAEIAPPIVPSGHGAALALTALAGLWSLRHLVRRPRGDSIFARVANADLVVTRGDALFVDRPDLKGLMSISAATLPSMVAHRWGVPAVITGTEVGPFRHWLPRAVCGFILRRAGLVVVRNDDSFTVARALGVPPGRVVALPDLAFGFVPATAAAQDAVRRTYALGNEPYAVVTIGTDLPVHGTDEFYGQLKVLLSRLLDAGVLRRVIIVLQVDGKHISDRSESERFVARMSDARVTLGADDLTPGALAALYAAAACSLGMRMHASILSLLAGTPTFPVAVWPKVRKLFATLGLDDSVIDFPSFPLERTQALITTRVDGGNVERTRLREVSRAQADKLSELEIILRKMARS
jgi:polysaccharide pyruvyl transferase WcaK-like protein